MPWFVSTRDRYEDGVYTKAGEPFLVELPKGVAPSKLWTPCDPSGAVHEEKAPKAQKEPTK